MKAFALEIIFNARDVANFTIKMIPNHMRRNSILNNNVLIANKIFKVTLLLYPVDLAKHYCSKKPKSCLHCGLDFANDAILQHENVCGSRTEKCQVCKKHIQLRDLRKHE